jgi:uncharacterized protein YfaS (alpha-2-macroglobulin family)
VKSGDDGKAFVEFDLPDTVTCFRVYADCFADSRLGTGSTLIECLEPFFVEPKLPPEVTVGDIIQLPLALVNETSSQLSGTVSPTVVGKGLKIVGEKNVEFILGPSQRIRKIFPIKIIGAETSLLRFSAAAGAYSDTVTRTVYISSAGFPFSYGSGGILEPNSTVSYDLPIPTSVVPHSFITHLKFFTTPVSSLTESLKAFINLPSGNFEQVSMTTYPLVLVLQYLHARAEVDPKIIENAYDNLSKGYERLVSFQTASGGFEWFGNEPGHEGRKKRMFLTLLSLDCIWNIAVKGYGFCHPHRS